MSFFTKVEAFFKRFVTNTTWEQKVSAGIGIAAPGLEIIVADTAGEADAVLIQNVVAEVQSDLAIVTGLLSKAQAGQNVSATIVNVLDSIKSNLSALLSAGHIKNQATLTKVEAIVKGVIDEVEAVLSLIPKN